MATRILVIDDEEDYRIIMSDVLGSEGYDIRLANDGKEGLAALADFKADVILVDWMMPNMDGQTFVQNLRSGGSKGMSL